MRFLESMSSIPSSDQHRTNESLSSLSPDVPVLNLLALRSLTALFDEGEKLFSRRVMSIRNGLRRDPASRKHTIMAVLGLHRLAQSSGAGPFDIDAIQDAVLQDRSWVNSAADLGLLTWFTAVCRPDQLDLVFKEFDFEKALSIYPDGREAQTTALALFLSGISFARIADPQPQLDLTDVAVEAYHLLESNQSQRGIFGHAGNAKFPRHKSVSRLGTFADQASAIFALSMFAKAFEVDEPLDPALACGNAICAAQGDLGQWWFLYNRQTGGVVGRYPLHSLNQYGLAPSALLTLGEVTGRNFSEPISKGLSWVARGNMLRNHFSLIELTSLWDSIGPARKLAEYLKATLGLFIPFHNSHSQFFEVRYEAQAENFGWLLYAFGNYGLPKEVAARFDIEPLATRVG
jgi:hypothetical protein